MRSTKVIAACIFNELLAAGLFLALDGTSMRTDPSTNGRRYRKSVIINNAIFIHNESLFIVSAATTSTFQLKHTPWLLSSICPAGYQIQTIDYGKILVMLLCRKYTVDVYTGYITTRGTRNAASLAQSRAWWLQTCSEWYVGMKLSKEVANVGVTVHVQQWLNGPHGTPVHDFLSVA